MRPEGQFAIPCAVPKAAASRHRSPPAETHTMRRPLRVRTVLCAAALGLACLAGTFSAPRPAEAFPKPSTYKIAWEFKFTHSVPKRIVVDSKAYWYITFAVMNTADE